MSTELTLDDLPQPAEQTTVHPDELEVDGDNPNEQTDDMFGLLCENMREYGWIGNAIVANTDGVIADGEHRWRAAQEIGLTEVPVKFYDIDESTRRLWRQELNKISGEHDTKRDALEYDYLLDAGKADEVQALTNAADEDLDELLAEIKMETPRPAAYEYDPDHNVYFQDCVEGMREHLEEDSVDCVITDPPYGIDYEPLRADRGEVDNYASGGIENDELEDTVALWHDFLSEVRRVCRGDAHIYAFGSMLHTHIFQDIFSEHFEFQNRLIWVKNNHSMGPDFSKNYGMAYEDVFYGHNSDGPRELSEFSTNVLEFDKENTSEYGHPTQKPVPLISFLVDQSTSEGDVVLDPFMGSGTTAVAAIQNNRDYVGFELDEDNYGDVIERRIGEAKRAREATVNQDSEE